MNKKYLLLIIFTFILGGLFSLSFGKVLSSEELVNNAQKELKTITTQELVKLLKDKPNTQIIDIRTKNDILKDGGFIKANKVTNIPRDKLEFLISNTVKENDTFVVHCLNGIEAL